MCLGTTVRGKENSREGNNGQNLVEYENETRGKSLMEQNGKKTGGDRLLAVILELWLHVLLRIFFGLTWVYLYCVVFEIFHVSELWLQVEGVQVRCLGVCWLCILV